MMNNRTGDKMAHLSYERYVRAQQRKAEKVAECMHLQKLDKEMSPLTRKMLEKNVDAVIIIPVKSGKNNCLNFIFIFITSPFIKWFIF